MKKLVLILGIVFVTMSSFSSFGELSNKDYGASCFEQAHWYGQWWRSVTGATANETAEVVLEYYENCEANSNSGLQNQI